MGSGTSAKSAASFSSVQVQNNRGPNPLCARAHAAGETCRNPTWPDLIHSSAVRSDGRRALSLSLALEELQNLHRGFPMKGRTDRWVYAVIHGFVARFCHITEHTEEEALALAFTLTPSV